MEVMRKVLRLTAIALLVAGITSVAYLAGYGSGMEGPSGSEPVQVDEGAPAPADTSDGDAAVLGGFGD